MLGWIHRFRVIPFASVVVALSLLFWAELPDQDPDPAFDPAVERPAYVSGGPRVLFDEAHWNIHKADGRYRPFVELIRQDGYQVEPSTAGFAPENLRGAQIVVSANALGVRGSLQALANQAGLEGKLNLQPDAFTVSERTALRDWVATGGSLLLIADHAPAGAAADQLSREFGVEMTNWYAEDGKHHDPDTDNWGFLVFQLEDGTLSDHAITRGDGPERRVSKVISFTGQALRVKNPAAAAFLKLSSTAIEYPKRESDDKDFRPAAGFAQGVALEHGKGRVVILGEAAMLTSQVTSTGMGTFRFGMSRRGYGNRQLALNIMHWLSRKLE